MIQTLYYKCNAAISFQCKLYCHVDPTKHFMVHKLLQAMKRSNKHTDTRLPITIDILNSIIPKLQTVCSKFHALHRVGEIEQSKGNTIQKLIQYGDVSLQENKVILNIQYSKKTDQLGLGTTLAIPASLNTSCTYSAIQDFLQVKAKTL